MESENNNLLPNRWSQGKLAEIISHTGIVSDGDWIESKDQDPNGAVRLVQLADIGDGKFLSKSSRYMTLEAANRLNCTFLKAGDILIARMPDPLGRACIFPEVEHKSVTVVDVCLIRTNENSALKNDLFKYWINTPQIRSEISLQATGSTRKRITRKKLSAFDFPIPPLPEQERIVKKLDSLLAQVDTIQQRLNNLPDIIKRFRQSVLAAAVSGKLTEQWREINEVNDWKTLTIGDISTFQNGFAFKSGWFADSGKYQVIKLGNVKDDYLKLEKSPAFINSDIAKEYIKYKPNVGDILISMTGTKYKGDYGYVCRVNEDLPILINQRVGRIVAKPDLIDSNFLLQYMRSELFRVEFLKGETGGVNQGNVGTKHIQSCPIGIPSLKEQTEIVRLVEQYFALADTLEKNLAIAKLRVDNLTQSILAKAFRGELVPQDPNDEPADKLLARIKAARLEAEMLEKAAKKAAKASKK